METTMASLNSARQFWRSAVRPPLVSRALAPWRRWKRSSEPPPGDGSGGDRGDPPGESSGGSSGEGGRGQDPPLCPQPSPKSPSGDPKLPPPPDVPRASFVPPPRCPQILIFLLPTETSIQCPQTHAPMSPFPIPVPPKPSPHCPQIPILHPHTPPLRSPNPHPNHPTPSPSRPHAPSPPLPDVPPCPHPSPPSSTMVA